MCRAIVATTIIIRLSSLQLLHGCVDKRAFIIPIRLRDLLLSHSPSRRFFKLLFNPNLKKYIFVFLSRAHSVFMENENDSEQE